MSRPARALINTAALKYNLNVVRQFAPQSRVMAIVKANGYGHGLITTVNALSAADEFGVASIDEALVMRDAGITHPITALEGFFHPTEIPLFVQHKITTVVHSHWQIEMLEHASGQGRVNVWLKVDTGMNRLGIKENDIESAIKRLQACNIVGDMGLLSHLARADETDSDATAKQIKRLETVATKHKLTVSMANSAAVVAWPTSHRDVVRPGLMLYGASPVKGKTAADCGLKPVMSLQSELIAINQQRKGDVIGYGGQWTCPQDMLVGVVALGYGDGYPRHGSGAPVIINDSHVPIIGRVSMDMITVDLRGVRAKVADTVELWGDDLSIDEIAQHAGTISYELMCHVTERVTRVIKDHNGKNQDSV